MEGGATLSHVQNGALYSSHEGELYRSYDKYAGLVGFYQVDEDINSLPNYGASQEPPKQFVPTQPQDPRFTQPQGPPSDPVQYSSMSAPNHNTAPQQGHAPHMAQYQSLSTPDPQQSMPPGPWNGPAGGRFQQAPSTHGSIQMPNGNSQGAPLHPPSNWNAPIPQGTAPILQGNAPMPQGALGVTASPVMQQPQQPPRPLQILGVGIKFGERINSKTGGLIVYVKRILEEGPAHKTRVIFPGDMLVSVDGMRLQGAGISSIRTRIPGPAGTTVQLGILGVRNGKEREFVVNVPRTAYGDEAGQGADGEGAPMESLAQRDMRSFAVTSHQMFRTDQRMPPSIARPGYGPRPSEYAPPQDTYVAPQQRLAPPQNAYLPSPKGNAVQPWQASGYHASMAQQHGHPMEPGPGGEEVQTIMVSKQGGRQLEQVVPTGSFQAPPVSAQGYMGGNSYSGPASDSSQDAMAQYYTQPNQELQSRPWENRFQLQQKQQVPAPPPSPGHHAADPPFISLGSLSSQQQYQALHGGGMSSGGYQGQSQSNGLDGAMVHVEDATRVEDDVPPLLGTQV